MNDQPINLRVLLLLVIAFGISLYARAQNNVRNPNTDSEILSKAITDSTLWENTSIPLESLSEIYLLDHGVTLDVPEQFTIQGILIKVIQKNQLSLVGDTPLVQVHTFNVENEAALVRLYLRYVENGVEKNTNTELWFNNDGANWNLITK
ncbi:hypothetical protein ACOCEA_16760 [Maribacter sp. CXY002]|uniref:hypothetical protein n=1 Tax=Maribacter luteocoastalis TaxID=3407671 RepID=UPI003B674489